MRHIALLGMVLMACGTVAPVRADEQQAAAVAKSANQFAADLYGHLAPAEGNLFCSPLSIYGVLAMTAGGARGDTAAEFANVLHLPGGDVHSSIGETLGRLEKPDANFELHIANAMWAQNGFSCLPGYQAILANDYKCDFFNLDFMDPGAASRSINDWVSKETSGKIPELFDPGSLPKGAKLVLTNAIYFHADWRSQFSAGRTSPGDFHVGGNGDVQRRTMMRQHGEFPFMHSDQFDALELPYKGQEVGMVILLPHSVDGLKDLEGRFSEKLLKDVMAGVQPQFAEVTIPRFTFASAPASLPEALKAMGLRRAFGQDADFSGIDGKPDIYLADVKHKAFVAVDEEGTTAAAATGGVMMPTAVPMPNVVFTADHPFLFVIVDHRTGAALFVGRVWDPGAK